MDSGAAHSIRSIDGYPPLFAFTEKMGVGTSYLGLSVQNDGEESAQKTGRIRRRPVNVLIDPGIANIVLHVVFLH